MQQVDYVNLAFSKKLRNVAIIAIGGFLLSGVGVHSIFFLGTIAALSYYYNELNKEVDLQ